MALENHQMVFHYQRGIRNPLQVYPCSIYPVDVIEVWRTAVYTW